MNPSDRGVDASTQSAGTSERKPRVRFFAGLDLGGPSEFTALVVLEQTSFTRDEWDDYPVRHYAVRHLERYPLGTPYPEVCSRVAALFAEPPLANGVLVIDQTGVGRPVADLLWRAVPRAALTLVTITAGHRVGPGGSAGWLVPKRELVSTLQIVLQERRLKIAVDLPESQTLVEELMNFRAKVSLAEAEDALDWRERPHDDLVLALAVGVWQGERVVPFRMEVLG
jgi:hypothetical protein